MKARPTMQGSPSPQDRLVDTAEIARVLGVGRRQVSERIVHGPDFPSPIINISQKTRRWSLEQVLRWSYRDTAMPPHALNQALAAASPGRSEVPQVRGQEAEACDGAGRELLAELQAAHTIIRNALSLMTPAQKLQWGILNERDGVEGEGVTRANERLELLTRASVGRLS